jgi:hypothetical protein
MGSLSIYWRLVRMDAAGKLRRDEILGSRELFHHRFSNQPDLSDIQIQQELFRVFQGQTAGSSDRNFARDCLRCFISYQIEQVCTRLEAKFGEQYGFTRHELLPFVLDDEIRQTNGSQSSYRSFASEILETFDPDRASLNTWVFRQVRYHRELNRFLRERGVYLISDWAILNDTRVEQCQRVLSEYYTLTPTEVEQASHLLRAYHEIYREDRRKLRQKGKVNGKEECSAPTLEQLERIAQLLPTPSLSSESVMNLLQALARQLRQYRIYIRGGALPTESLDRPEISMVATEVESPEPDALHSEQNDFLRLYRETFLQCLDEAIAQVIDERTTYLQRKSAAKVQPLLTALELFHCQGKSMGRIAPLVGLQEQFEVSRLMNLKELRASVRQRMLERLSDRILTIAKIYADPNQLQDIDRRIEAALAEQIDQVIEEAKNTSAVGKTNSPLAGLFAHRLCHHLDTRRNES